MPKIELCYSAGLASLKGINGDERTVFCERDVVILFFKTRKDLVLFCIYCKGRRSKNVAIVYFCTDLG